MSTSRLLSGLALSCALVLIAPVTSVAQQLDDLRIDVAFLSSDLLEGRGTGTAGERLAADYIVDRFRDIGLEPGADGSWLQSFEVRISANPHAAPGEGDARTGHNVLGLLDNGAETTVVIGAHYDHLGYGGSGSRAPNEMAIHNGADDNASGVAAIVEIARRLTDKGPANNNYLFVAFSGEELGLHGSKFLVDSPALADRNINYMINLDMVGRLNEERTLAVNGTGTSPAWGSALDAAAETANLRLSRHESGLGPSDHASFYLADIPVIHLFTGQHEQYHRPDDDSQFINYDGLADVSTFAVEVIAALDDDGRLAFTETDDESQNQQMSFSVTLGVMPDYVYDGEGLRIDAVLDGKSGDAAGLEGGDIVLRMGDREIGDVYAYMEALGAFEPGDTITVVVKRGDEEIEKTVTFQE
ncbi:MAG: M20/M25/M40 family metallo-hydrolase [Rhodothermales bacterium]|nr:M20/M25/M40 family metallo-hydrolase [Rhodothermales bacterium]